MDDTALAAPEVERMHEFRVPVDDHVGVACNDQPNHSTQGHTYDFVLRPNASIYRRMRTGTFPLPLKLGERAVAWRADEIDNWIASRPRCNGMSTSLLALVARANSFSERNSFARHPVAMRPLSPIGENRRSSSIRTTFCFSWESTPNSAIS